MDKIDFLKQFAHRLREAMLKAGYISHRSVFGISIQKLAQMSGCSLQICRKYLHGEVLPDPIKLLDISQKLHVSPGWLLFGEFKENTNPTDDKIIIKKNLLHYIFLRARCLYNDPLLEKDVPDFLMDLLDDVAMIDAGFEQSIKIIDLAISSVKHFNKTTKDVT